MAHCIIPLKEVVMSGSTWFTGVGRRITAGAIALLLGAGTLEAQTGRITGTVTDGNAAPVQGAQVSVVGTSVGSLTNASGQFLLIGVPAGQQQVTVQFTGYRTVTVPVTVRDGEAASVQVRLESTAIQLGGIVVSASRREQRLTDAPATITRITPEVLDNSVGNTWAGALKQVPGLDFIQVGMTAVAVNARGFNSSFNNRMLMMEDGRIAVLPENGLPVGMFTAVPKVDLAAVEVLVGPGAALYGADASSGVITLQSKDPRLFPGTTVEMTAGNRSYRDIQARQAGVVGNWGYKVAGEWQDAQDWGTAQTYMVGGVAVVDTAMGENSVDWSANQLRGTGSIVRYFDFGQVDVSAGASRTNGVGQTNVGKNQLRDWGYNYAQARFSSANWFLNAYRTQSTSGDSYALNRYAEFWRNNPTLSPDSVRMLSDWPSNGRLFAAEVQNNFRVPAALNTQLVWGAQYRRDVVSSDRQWLLDRLTGEDLTINQYGVYAQTETPLVAGLNLVLAGRYDDHENYAAQFSPKAALVFQPTQEQAFRLSYNRAFKSPTTLQTSFYIPDWTAVISVLGNRDGYTVQGGQNGTLTYDPLRAEENVTWELGYRGVLGGRLFLDVAGYHSRYQDFLSPLAIISDPFGLGLAGQPAGVQTFAYDANGNRVVNHNGIPPIMLTYYNLGNATIYGTDAGANFYLTPRVSMRGTFSWLKLDEMEVPTGREEATSLNSPSVKWTLGTNLTDFGALSGGAIVRHVSSYYFRSGVNMGVVPTFTTLDLNAAYALPRWNSAVTMGISNIAGCSQDQDAPFTYAATDPLRTTPTNRSRKCGVAVRHREMLNMPAIGTMLFVGLRYHVQ
jgi:outer membrane receptor for ferrienterochelin and colicins